MNIHYPNTGHLVELANKNRENPTKAEKNFIYFCEWMNIPYKFQVPIYCDEKGYILDFDLCFTFEENGKQKEVHYVVEIDGFYHNSSDQKEKDKERTKNILLGKYKKVIRIPNEKTEDCDTLFKALYKGIPNTGKFGPVLRKWLQKRYNIVESGMKNCFFEIKNVDKLRQSVSETPKETINEKEIYLTQINQLKEEIETLKKANWVLSKQIYDTQIERDRWMEKAEELNNNLWSLSAYCGNYRYFKSSKDENLY